MTASQNAPEARPRRSHPSSWFHLIRRFFGFISARPLSPREQSEVAGLLADREAPLFWEQAGPDQRHALIVARRVLVERPGDREAARAALLHDVGKRAVGLGAVQRSLATVISRLGLPLGENYRAYHEHGRIGASDLEAAGADGLVVAFALHHPGPAPPDVDPEQWRALLEADHG